MSDFLYSPLPVGGSGDTVLDLPDGIAINYDNDDLYPRTPSPREQRQFHDDESDLFEDVPDVRKASDGYFSLLPDELVEEIMKNLSIRDYLRFSYSCSRIYHLSLNEELWEPVGEGFFSSELPRGTKHSRQNCVRAMITEKNNRIMAERARREKKARKLRKKCSKGFLYFSGFSIVHELLLAAALLVLFVLIALKADYRLDCGWAVVMIPFYPIVFFYVMRIVAYLFVANCTRVYVDTATDSSNPVMPNVIHLLPRIGFAHYLSDGWFDPISYAAFLLMGLASLILLAIQVISGGQAMMWTTVLSCFAGVGLFALIMMIGLDDGCFSDSESFWFRFPAVLPLLGYMSSCIVVGLRVDDILSPALDWNTVFIPIYLTLVSLFLVPFVCYCINSCTVSTSNYANWLIIGVFLCCILMIPGVVFIGTLASMLNGVADSSNVSLFVPIFIQCVAALAISLIAWLCRK